MQKVRVLAYFITNIRTFRGGDYTIEGCSGTIYAMRQRIRAKLIASDATSREKAVTAQEANLDEQERNWLHYVAGGLLSTVKKTNDDRYYV